MAAFGGSGAFKRFVDPPAHHHLRGSRLKTLGLVDKVVNEPLGGAHRDPAEMAKSMKKALADALKPLRDLSVPELLERRQDRLVGYGKFKEVAA